MPPLIVMIVSFMAFWVMGAAGLVAISWIDALRLALATMFVFTAASHFAARTRPDLVRMVPPRLPQPALLVSLTGVLEFAGAMGLLLPRFAAAAAWGLAALLVAMFPANIHADRTALVVAGRRATPLTLRLPIQVFWIAALVWVAVQ